MKRKCLLLAAFAAMTVCAYAQDVKCDIVNEGTRRFLEEVDYADDPEYTVSYGVASHPLSRPLLQHPLALALSAAV